MTKITNIKKYQNICNQHTPFNNLKKKSRQFLNQNTGNFNGLRNKIYLSLFYKEYISTLKIDITLNEKVEKISQANGSRKQEGFVILTSGNKNSS